MSKSTLAPRALMEALTPEGVEALLDFHRATFGDARMDATTPPERPEGVSEEEWNALGDPGKAALVRERERASAAERELAAARAGQQQTGAPKPGPRASSQGAKQPEGESGEGGRPADLAAIIAQAVTAAVTPLQQRIDGWEAGQAAQRIADAVTSAASHFHDPSDVLAQVDLAALTDGSGGPDVAKITAALDALATSKPHLVRPFDDRRRVAPGSTIGATGSSAASLDDQVKARLQKMQKTTGIKLN